MTHRFQWRSPFWQNDVFSSAMLLAVLGKATTALQPGALHPRQPLFVKYQAEKNRKYHGKRQNGHSLMIIISHKREVK